ncbi:MAG: hypothetical protein ACMUEK_00525 [Sodalis sp. (in: enterobacteria)]
MILPGIPYRHAALIYGYPLISEKSTDGTWVTYLATHFRDTSRA